MHAGAHCCRLGLFLRTKALQGATKLTESSTSHLHKCVRLPSAPQSRGCPNVEAWPDANKTVRQKGRIMLKNRLLWHDSIDVVTPCTFYIMFGDDHFFHDGCFLPGTESFSASNHQKANESSNQDKMYRVRQNQSGQRRSPQRQGPSYLVHIQSRHVQPPRAITTATWGHKVLIFFKANFMYNTSLVLLLPTWQNWRVLLGTISSTAKHIQRRYVQPLEAITEAT